MFVYVHTSLTLYMNALRSLNRNVLPAEMVCAVSPAQNKPCGLRHSFRSTTKGGCQSRPESHKVDGITKGINEEVILHLVDIAGGATRREMQ